MAREWYVAQVLTGRELDAVAEIKKLPELDAIAPMELRHEWRGGKLHERLHVYIPGYVFVLGDLRRPCAYYAIRAIKGVIRILGGGQPERVPLDQMRLVLGLARHGATMRPAPVAIQESGAVISGGPLAAMGPAVTKINTRDRRATLEVPLMGQTTTVTVTVDIQPGDAARDALRTRQTAITTGSPAARTSKAPNGEA